MLSQALFNLHIINGIFYRNQTFFVILSKFTSDMKILFSSDLISISNMAINKNCLIKFIKT